jgi:hypothetical protein
LEHGVLHIFAGCGKFVQQIEPSAAKAAADLIALDGAAGSRTLSNPVAYRNVLAASGERPMPKTSVPLLAYSKLPVKIQENKSIFQMLFYCGIKEIHSYETNSLW